MIARRSPSTLEKLTATGLAAFGIGSLWTLVLDVVVLNTFIMPALVVGLVLLAAAVAVLSGLRWMALVGALLAIAMLGGTFAAGLGLERLQNPETTQFLLATLLMLAGGVLAAVCGIGATVQRQRAATPTASG